CRQELQKKAPGPPAVPGALTIGSELLGYGQAYSRGNLLRAQKVLVRGMFEVLALQRHDSLVSCRVGALVDGHRQMALTEQCSRTRTARRDRSSDPTRIESGAGAHLVRSSVIDHQHPHRTVALRLQNEAALEPKCRAEQDGEHDRLAQEPCDRRGVAMPRKNAIDRWTEAHQTAPQAEGVDLEGQKRVVCGSRRRRTRRNDNMGFWH